MIDGWKFFSSNARTASFLIVMAVTDPDVSPYKGMSMFLVPTDTPGVEHRAQHRARRRADGRGLARAASTTTTSGCRPTRCSAARARRFAIAQTRLGGGRIHHAMRTVGMCQQAFDMMCERALSRDDAGRACSPTSSSSRATSPTRGRSSQQFRLLVLYTAWEIDQYNDYKRVRKDIAVVKVVMPTCCTTSRGGPCRCTARSASPTRCPSSA